MFSIQFVIGALQISYDDDDDDDDDDLLDHVTLLNKGIPARDALDCALHKSVLLGKRVKYIPIAGNEYQHGMVYTSHSTQYVSFRGRSWLAQNPVSVKSDCNQVTTQKPKTTATKAIHTNKTKSNETKLHLGAF